MEQKKDEKVSLLWKFWPEAIQNEQNTEGVFGIEHKVEQNVKNDVEFLWMG